MEPPCSNLSILPSKLSLCLSVLSIKGVRSTAFSGEIESLFSTNTS